MENVHSSAASNSADCVSNADNGNKANRIDNSDNEDTNALVLYWNGKENINNCDVWVWWNGKAGRGYRLHPCEYGAKCTIDVPKCVEHVGFIVRTSCSDPCGSVWGTAYKDWNEDRMATIAGGQTTIYLKSGDGNLYVSNDNGRTLNPIRAFSFAEMVDRNSIRFHVSPKVCISANSQISVTDENGDKLEIREINPWGSLSETGTVVLNENLDIAHSYKMSIEGYGEKTVVPTHIFDSQWFVNNFIYDGDDLGATLHSKRTPGLESLQDAKQWEGAKASGFARTSDYAGTSVQEMGADNDGTTFKVWAPTAQRVVVNLFDDGCNGEAFASVPLSRGDKGVWAATVKSNVCHHGTYYTYTVTTAVGTQEAVDPYARAVGVNGDRGMVVDMGLTNPENWAGDLYVDTVNSYSDAVVWEVHVRDFSNKNPLSKYPGKYLAFTETGHFNGAQSPRQAQQNALDNRVGSVPSSPQASALDNALGGPQGSTDSTPSSPQGRVPIGMEHVRELGITHIQLNPVFDFATVDEAAGKAEGSKTTENAIETDITTANANKVSATSTTSTKTPSESRQFNWGYDPKNFNVPEGSYSTDPFNGEVRINEFKRMVQAIHRHNIGVVMDVVYNHTYDANSNFNRIVPYYYYRYTFNGANSNGSGCGNETASQRAMFRKFIVDSIRFWAIEYHIDGFRFDLMAVHDTDTMQAVEEALHKINPKALVYGEGWAGGTCALDPGLLATQHNIAKVHVSHNAIGSIAVFNDVIRDGLKGNVFDVQSRGYINGGICYDSANKVSFGLKGGVGTHGICWAVRGAMVVNYMSSHDNNTLWDKLKLSNINASKQELLAMNRLGAACVLLSRGMAFMLAGEELLRSKNGDGNSYNASDDINNIGWIGLTTDEDALAMAKWYKDLIALRKANPFIGNSHVSCNILEDNAIEALYHYNGTLKGYALFNPNGHPIHHSLPHGQWKLLLCGQDFVLGSQTIEGKTFVPEKGVLLATR